MDAILLRNHIYTKVEALTEDQLLLVNDFVGLLEKVVPKGRKSAINKSKTRAINGERDMIPIYELQKLFREVGITSLVDDVILERDDRLVFYDC